MTTIADDSQIVPRPPRNRPCAPPTAKAETNKMHHRCQPDAEIGLPWPTAWNPSFPTTPAASTPPSGVCSTTGTTWWGCAPCRRSR